MRRIHVPVNGSLDVQQYIYTNRDGKQVLMDRFACWEVILSAPTSVSLAALVGGDERIRKAHRKAGDTALAGLEEYNFAKMEDTESSRQTGKMVAARFEHDVAPAAKESGQSKIRRRGFSIYFAEAADFSDILLNIRIFAAQISVRQNCHCRNLDADLIEFSKRNEKLRHLI